MFRYIRVNSLGSLLSTDTDFYTIAEITTVSKVDLIPSSAQFMSSTSFVNSQYIFEWPETDWMITPRYARMVALVHYVHNMAPGVIRPPTCHGLMQFQGRPAAAEMIRAEIRVFSNRVDTDRHPKADPRYARSPHFYYISKASFLAT